MKDLLNRNFQNPGDEFVRYFVKYTGDGKSSVKQIEQYRPIVKKSIASVINDIIADRLNVAIKNENTTDKQPEDGNVCKNDPTAHPETEKLTDGVVFQDKEKGIITTQEEVDAYNIVRSILRQYVDVKRIQYNDYKSYFTVNLDGSTWWWICHLYLGKRKKQFCIPKDNYSSNEWIEIESIDDIFKYADKLKEAFDLAIASADKSK